MPPASAMDRLGRAQRGSHRQSRRMVGKTTRVTRAGVSPAANAICGYLIVEAEYGGGRRPALRRPSTHHRVFRRWGRYHAFRDRPAGVISRGRVPLRTQPLGGGSNHLFTISRYSFVRQMVSDDSILRTVLVLRGLTSEGHAGRDWFSLVRSCRAVCFGHRRSRSLAQ